MLPIETDPNTRIVLLDDDVIFQPTMLAELSAGANRHPNASVGFSGGVITDRFFRIGWKPDMVHGSLFFNMSGWETFTGESQVDILQVC